MFDDMNRDEYQLWDAEITQRLDEEMTVSVLKIKTADPQLLDQLLVRLNRAIEVEKQARRICNRLLSWGDVVDEECIEAVNALKDILASIPTNEVDLNCLMECVTCGHGKVYHRCNDKQQGCLHKGCTCGRFTLVPNTIPTNRNDI